jgi:hypothetical protein
MRKFGSSSGRRARCHARRVHDRAMRDTAARRSPARVTTLVMRGAERAAVASSRLTAPI